MPAAYLFRRIPDKLWRAAKVKAASERKSVRAILLELLAQYVAGPTLTKRVH